MTIKYIVYSSLPDRETDEDTIDILAIVDTEEEADRLSTEAYEAAGDSFDAEQLIIGVKTFDETPLSVAERLKAVLVREFGDDYEDDEDEDEESDE